MIEASTGGERARQGWARLAGLMLILTNGTAAFGFWVRDSYLAQGDAAATAEHLAASATFVRLGLAAELVTIAGVIPIAVGFYILLEPAGRGLALLALAWRLIENAVLVVLVFASLTALTLVGGGDFIKALTPPQVADLAYALVRVHSWGFQPGFLFLGLGQALFASLWWRSRCVPRWLAGLGIAASLVMAAMALAITVWPPLFLKLGVAYMMPMGLYEIGLGLWLVVRGVAPAGQARDAG
ncbi:MAG: hypothetical protein QOG84_2846 [Sphingomonadales bacterium]|nr:hypothetical protein [Sphingomonadales bacterium]